MQGNSLSWTMMDAPTVKASDVVKVSGSLGTPLKIESVTTERVSAKGTRGCGQSDLWGLDNKDKSLYSHQPRAYTGRILKNCSL